MENYTKKVALIVIMIGLWLGRFHYLFTKNALRTFIELLLRAQKYSNADELANTERNIDPD